MRPLRWGILGYGRAGRARGRAILADPGSELVGAWRGQPEQDGVPRFESPEALLARCEAVAVCTPNGLHARWTRAALEAGCHVACEFPLAGSAAEASALMALADARGRVLHVEHIELLGGAQAALREARARCAARLVEGEVRFTSSDDGWLGDPALSLGVARRNVARLHRLWDLLGPLRVVAVQTRSEGRLRAALEGAGGPITLDFTHAAGLPRRTELRLRFEDGAELALLGREARLDGVALPLPERPPLFAADHALIHARILGDGPEKPDRDQVLGVLALADDLEFRGLASP